MTVSTARERLDGPALEEGYSRWVRTALARCAETPDAIVLFDSTIPEPTELLADVIRRAFSDKVTDRYESVFAAGNRFVAQAVAKRSGVLADQVIGAAGATSAMTMAIRAFVRPGERVLIETPGFDLLASLAREAGAVVDFLPRWAPEFGVDPAELDAAILPDTRLVVLTQLHNPTGAALSRQTLDAIAQVARRRSVKVLIDAVYGDFLGDAGAIPSHPEFIVASSLSKVHGLFALRCGWLTASRQDIARIEAANPQGDLAVSKLTHAIGALVLEDIEPFDAHWRACLRTTRSAVEPHIRAMIQEGLLDGELPQAGCMYFPRVIGVEDTLSLSERLWAQDRLVVAPGEHFGLAGHIRIGLGGEADQLERGIVRLATALRKERDTRA